MISLIANPFTLDLQNCAEHTLDVMMAAIDNAQDLKVIKADEKVNFEAQSVTVKLAIGSTISADVIIFDHPGRPETATVETSGRFLRKYDASTEILTITPGQ